MPTEVIMPQMGESIAEGTITRWLAKVGDKVQRDQPLFEISTDKVDAEIPSPAEGVLLEIRAQEGATVPVNQVVALIGAAEEKAAEAKPPAVPVREEAGAPAAPAETAAAPQPVVPEKPATPEAAAESKPAAEEPVPGSEEERIRRFSSPVVRKIAAEEGVDIAEVEGTGIHGRVTKDDMLRYVEQRKAAAAAGEAARVPPAEAAAPPPAAVAPRERVVQAPARREPEGFYVPAYVEGENVEIVPMTRIRQITAAHMRYSKDTAAHVSTVFHMDFSRVHRARERAKRGFEKAHGSKLTYMPFIFKAVANALKANPKLNAAVDGTDVVFKKDINLGMAVALDWGLIVPVIRNADQLNLIGLAKAANDLADRARTKKLSPDEVKGGTFTITNPGVFGSLFGTPIINQPQVGILGIGAIEKRVVVETDETGNDRIVIKPMAYFAITYDHRLVDGADADHFMNHVKRVLLEETWSELEAF